MRAFCSRRTRVALPSIFNMDAHQPHPFLQSVTGRKVIRSLSYEQDPDTTGPITHLTQLILTMSDQQSIMLSCVMFQRRLSRGTFKLVVFFRRTDSAVSFLGVGGLVFRRLRLAGLSCLRRSVLYTQATGHVRSVNNGVNNHVKTPVMGSKRN